MELGAVLNGLKSGKCSNSVIFIRKTRPSYLRFWKTMAVDIPYDQIRELQISLRKEAGLASYIPEDPQLPDLPSLQDAISELDPSPPYLRCKLCKGRLLRVNSVICVFCGRQQSKDPPPEPIKFSSTFAYRWFLQSLDLDGSVRSKFPNRQFFSLCVEYCLNVFAFNV